MITFLNIVVFTAKALGMCAVTGMVVIGFDMIYYHIKDAGDARREKAADTKNSIREMIRKEKLRQEKAESATGGFFEESYVPGFDSTGLLLYRDEHGYITEEVSTYAKKLDDLLADQIFKNTEEL